MARLLIANGANVNFTNSKMCTPLIAVCKANGIVALAQVLINNGADVNAALENGETAFWWAFFLKISLWHVFSSITGLIFMLLVMVACFQP